MSTPHHTQGHTKFELQERPGWGHWQVQSVEHGILDLADVSSAPHWV